MRELQSLEKELRGVAGEDSYFEARQLLESAEDEEQLKSRISRRKSGEPLQYILGEWEFYGIKLSVSPKVLIPRPDSETLAESAIGRIRERGYRKVLDLCCGSGCIGLAIKKHTEAEITLGDISPDALEVARHNAESNGLEVEIVCSDMFDSIEGEYDCIVINPPYLSKRDMENLQREVEFEPKIALYGGEDGLSFYRRIAKDYGKHLKKGGSLFMEIGYGQAESVMAMFENGQAIRDLNGIERVIVTEE
ncbi:MAG: peptide chain release factor N(5)-glutamine methyltransferase [Clostridia bacterium]|nr:peptide chain release factor N(5)-glutamine methyltransferase [Clostridia bacterium]